MKYPNNFPKKKDILSQIKYAVRLAGVCANMAEALRKKRYKASFVAKLNDCQAEAAETLVWLKFSVKCHYISTEQGRELYSTYNQIQGYKDPWLIVTDLEAEQGNPLWYGLRSWIESSYRDLKSDGWQWHKTRLREPARAERIWLAMAVATLWTITMGSEEQTHSPETLTEKTIEDHNPSPKSALKKVNRSISCFLQGLINIVANLICGKAIYLNDLYPTSSFAVNTS